MASYGTPGHILNNEELRIVLVGKTGAGKSATGNTILGRKAFSSRNSPISLTESCDKSRGVVNGQNVAVVDSPGLFDNRFRQDKTIKDIKQCICFASPGPHVFLVVIKMGRFTEEEKKTVEMIQEIFGDQAAKYTMVLVTNGDQLDEDQSIEDFVQASPDLRGLISKCHGRYHVFNNKDKDHSQVSELLKKIKKMVLQNGGNHYTTDMFQEAERAIEEEKLRILKEREDQIRREEEKIKKKYEAELKSALEEVKKELKRKHEEELKKKREDEEKAELKSAQEEKKKELKRKHEEELKKKREDEEKAELKSTLEEEKKELKRKHEEELKKKDEEKAELKSALEEKKKELKRKHEEELKKKDEEKAELKSALEEKKKELQRKLDEDLKKIREDEEKEARDKAERCNKFMVVGGGIGAVSGLAVGAGIGAFVGGPVGAVVGGVVGVVGGAVFGVAAGYSIS